MAASEVQGARQQAAVANQQLEAVRSEAQQATQLAKAETAAVQQEARSQLAQAHQAVDESSRAAAQARSQLEDAQQRIGELDQVNALARDKERYLALDLENLRIAYHDLLVKANNYAERATAELQGIHQQRIDDQKAAEQKILLMVEDKKAMESHFNLAKNQLDLRYQELQSQFGSFKANAEESDVHMRRNYTQIQAELNIAHEQIQKEHLELTNAQEVIRSHSVTLEAQKTALEK